MPLHDLPARRAPDDPREWLNRAGGNLRRARLTAPGIYFEDLCYDAQQAAEKALKAFLLSRGLPFPFTHDLSLLVTAVEVEAGQLPQGVRDSAGLTRYAVATRYPGTAEEVTDEDYLDAIRIADAVIAWVTHEIEGPDAPSTATHR